LADDKPINLGGIGNEAEVIWLATEISELLDILLQIALGDFYPDFSDILLHYQIFPQRISSWTINRITSRWLIIGVDSSISQHHDQSLHHKIHCNPDHFVMPWIARLPGTAHVYLSFLGQFFAQTNHR
jgi:hypothetical protein